MKDQVMKNEKEVKDEGKMKESDGKMRNRKI
jgi:hypothetical protein